MVSICPARLSVITQAAGILQLDLQHLHGCGDDDLAHSCTAACQHLSEHCQLTADGTQRHVRRIRTQVGRCSRERGCFQSQNSPIFAQPVPKEVIRSELDGLLGGYQREIYRSSCSANKNKNIVLWEIHGDKRNSLR